MADRTVTLQNLMDRVRTRGEWRASWLTDVELIDYINDSCAAFHDFILTVHPYHDPLLKMADVTITSGQDKYTFPTDSFKIYGISVWDGTTADGYVPLEQIRWDERYSLDGYNSSSEKQEARWIKYGNSFLVSPTPRWSGKVRIEYAAVLTPATSVSNTYDLDNRWWEWIILDVCVKCCAKEESDPSIYLAQQKNVQDRIAATLKVEDDIDNIPKSTSTSTTLADIRRAIRNRGKWTQDDITNTTLTDWINSSVDSLEDFIISTDPTHSSMLTFSDIQVVAGTMIYDLPTGLHTLYGVSAKDGTFPDGYSILEQYRWDERYADGYQNITSGKQYTRWERWGSHLRLQPTPSWNGKVRLEYAKSFPVLSSPTSTLDFENSWNEWLILDVCIKCCAKMGISPDVFINQQKAIQERMVAALRMEDQISQLPKGVSGSTTLNDLRKSIRSRGKWMRNDIGDRQLNQFINAALKSMVDMLIMGDPQMFDTMSDINVTSGIKYYTLPTNLYRLTGVAMRDSNARDGYTVMARVDWDERYDSALASGEKAETRYSLIGDRIMFQPTPNWSDTVRLSYVSYPTNFYNPTDTYNFRNGWEEYVILDAASKVALLMGQNPAPYQQMRDEVVKRIQKSVIRDMAKPRTIIDSQRRWSRSRQSWRRFPGW